MRTLIPILAAISLISSLIAAPKETSQKRLGLSVNLTTNGVIFEGTIPLDQRLPFVALPGNLSAIANRKVAPKKIASSSPEARQGLVAEASFINRTGDDFEVSFYNRASARHKVQFSLSPTYGEDQIWTSAPDAWDLSPGEDSNEDGEPDAATEVRFASGETWRRTVRVPMKDIEGNPLSPGLYTITVHAGGTPGATASTTFQINPPPPPEGQPGFTTGISGTAFREGPRWQHVASNIVVTELNPPNRAAYTWSGELAAGASFDVRAFPGTYRVEFTEKTPPSWRAAMTGFEIVTVTDGEFAWAWHRFENEPPVNGRVTGTVFPHSVIEISPTPGI